MNVLAMVMAGGEGNRLLPLTSDRAKPAVPFGGAYRIIDFVMTNLFNSGVYKFALLTQYKPGSLNRHIREGYRPIFAGRLGFLETFYSNGLQYKGTADAVYKNIGILKAENFDIVDVFGADHIYRMNVAQMHEHHLAKGSDVTISVMPVPVEVARGNLGVVVVDGEGRIRRFEEKPDKPTPMPGDLSKALVSMGNYSFNPSSLEDALRQNPRDFGIDVVPKMIGDGKRVFAYDFTQNTLQGFRPEEVVYWRDVGRLQDFYDAHMDLLGENPVLRLQHQKWKMLTNIELPEPSRIAGRAISLDSILANGVWIHDDASARGSVLSYGVEVLPNASVTNSILMGYIVVGQGTVIKNAIVDRHVNIPPDISIGINHADDLKRGFTVIDHPKGHKITVVPRGHNFK